MLKDVVNMHKTLLYSVLYGVLFGFCFPFSAWFIDLIINERLFTISNIGIIHSNNSLHWIIDLAPFVLGGAGYIIGTQRQRLEIYTQSLEDQVKERTLELIEKEQYLSLTLDSIGDAVISTDTNGNIVRMNLMAEQLTDWSSEDALGKNVKEIFNIIHTITKKPLENPVLAGKCIN